MKRILFFIAGALLSVSSYCQTLSFNDLEHLYKNKDAGSFLIAKGFSITGKQKDLVFFSLNKNTNKEETVWVDPRGLIYHSYDSEYMLTLIKQVKKRYTLIIKDNGPPSIFYQFGNTDINIMVNLHNQAGKFNSLSIGKR